MMIGEPFYAADWLRGDETDEELAVLRKSHERALERAAEQHGVIFGPPKFYDVPPGHELCGDPPPGWQGPNVRFFIAEASVVCMKPQFTLDNGFSKQLDTKDLKAMREATRRAHRLAHGPKARELTDKECDTLIDAIAPGTEERLLREAAEAVRH